MSRSKQLFSRASARLRSSPSHTLIIGAVLCSIISGALSIFALFASVEQRPAASGSDEFIMLYTEATSGLANLELEVGDPIMLNRPEEPVNVVIRARVGNPLSRTLLIVSPGLKTRLENCAGIESMIEFSPDELDSGIRNALELVDEAFPRRGALAPSPSSTPTQVSVERESFLTAQLHFETASDFVHDYDLRSKAYPSSEAVVSCSMKAAHLVKSAIPIGVGIETVLVEAPTLAVRMSGGDDESLARASYDVRIGDAVDWTVRRTSFNSIVKQNGDAEDVRWSATGSFWSRFGEEPLGVLQPGGRAILEPTGASTRRAIVRLSAGFGAALSIGLMVTAARRTITLIATRANESR